MLNEVCVNLCPRIANVDRKNLPLLPFTAWFRFFMAQFLRTLTALRRPGGHRRLPIVTGRSRLADQAVFPGGGQRPAARPGALTSTRACWIRRGARATDSQLPRGG
jgi:hypothetical protein